MIVCFFGDSIVNGVNDPEALGWAGRLCVSARSKGCELTAYNLGIRRNTTADVLARWQEELMRRIMPGVPMHLVFACGAVDMVLEQGAPLVPLHQSLENVRAILEPASASYPVLVVGPPPMADREFTNRLVELDVAYAGLCAELDVPYLSVLHDLQDSELYASDLENGDGIHPASVGYGHIFRLVEGWDEWEAWINGSKE